MGPISTKTNLTVESTALTIKKKPEPEIVLPEKLWDKYSKRSITAHHQLVKAIYKLIEIKDMRTANHCRAVAYYSECIGIYLGLKAKDVELLKDAAMLHDIGKIMVDLAILNKQDKLTSRELLQIQCHSEIGMRILSGFHLNEEIVDAAWHHHERWDGNGYPDGLNGANINLFTRIICVSDALEAMSAKRPYDNPLPFEKIISELTEGAGAQFDPLIAEGARDLLLKRQIDIMG